ncbi:hypothetical protein [Anaeromyxobacter oryzae]|uniref:Uncharacterized protein n=1 Tax=Anaeromyxobacter oryzae TaxID=2918170 RepID=A0ABN6N1X9_9BACT|nr:hypothetical protein [Anaeromyxobacter oryzae]BDG05848.1 hypothetical protein AMOR_48440 [Anaeromyxobacter oryzae]
MGTIVRFALHGAGAQSYRAAFTVLAQLGLAALEDPSQGLTASRVFPASALAAPTDRTEDLCRAAFVALQQASLRPVAVSACRLDAAANA